MKISQLLVRFHQSSFLAKSKSNAELWRVRQSYSGQPASGVGLEVWHFGAAGAILLAILIHTWKSPVLSRYLPVGLPWIQGIWLLQLLDYGNIWPSSVLIHLQNLKVQDLAVHLRSGDPHTLGLTDLGKVPEQSHSAHIIYPGSPVNPDSLLDRKPVLTPGSPETQHPGWGYGVRGTRNMGLTEKSSDMILRATASD